MLQMKLRVELKLIKTENQNFNGQAQHIRFSILTTYLRWTVLGNWNR